MFSKEKREPEGWMKTEELRGKRLMKTPLCWWSGGPVRMDGALGGVGGLRGLNRKLKAPGEPGGTSSRFGFVGGGVPSAGCSSHGHLRKRNEGWGGGALKPLGPPKATLLILFFFFFALTDYAERLFSKCAMSTPQPNKHINE